MRWLPVLVPVAAGTLLAAITVTSTLPQGERSPTPRAERSPAPTPTPTADEPAFGAFLGSGATGVERVPRFESWLGGTEVTVGHTYLPGETWEAIEGDSDVLDPWVTWLNEQQGRLLVLNVPIAAPNEGDLSDAEVRSLLTRGADGEFNERFERLAERLVADGAEDTILVPGWEMNGTTYSGRCEPDPEAWKRYWRQIVTTMRAVEGQDFRFDFNPNRGRDAIPWTECYPGDDVVDIIGMDTYDQPPGESFDDYVNQPYGLRQHAEFAAARQKPISFPEWGMFRYGDNPTYVRRMHEWIGTHDVAYHTITDYCPHGVWWCPENPSASRMFRQLFGSTAGQNGGSRLFAP